jgi:uncharacterized protein YndB with AHSA1/START domain
MSPDQAPCAKAEMLIRRPVSEVFEAFVDPAITSKFWFTRGSGRLEAGRRSPGTGRCTTSPCR